MVPYSDPLNPYLPRTVEVWLDSAGVGYLIAQTSVAMPGAEDLKIEEIGTSGKASIHFVPNYYPEYKRFIVEADEWNDLKARKSHIAAQIGAYGSTIDFFIDGVKRHSEAFDYVRKPNMDTYGLTMLIGKPFHHYGGDNSHSRIRRVRVTQAVRYSGDFDPNLQ